MKCPPKLIATDDYRKMMEETTSSEKKAVTFTDRFMCAPEDIESKTQLEKVRNPQVLMT